MYGRFKSWLKKYDGAWSWWLDAHLPMSKDERELYERLFGDDGLTVLDGMLR